MMRTAGTIWLTLFLLLLFHCTVFAAPVPEYADEAMTHLQQSQIITNYEDANPFITREGFCVMLAKALSDPELPNADRLALGGALSVFADEADIRDEAFPFILYLYDKGLLRGVPENGQFYMYPQRLMTRQEALTLTEQSIASETEDTGRFDFLFADDHLISSFAKPGIYRLYHRNLISGCPDGTIKPLDPLTLADASVLIYTALSNKPIPETTPTPTPIPPVDEEPIREQEQEQEPPAAAVLQTYAGSGVIGNVTGMSAETRFSIPQGLCMDNEGALIVFDTYNASVKKVTDDNTETLLGFVTVTDDYGMVQPHYLDGDSQTALFGRPMDGVYAPNGDLYIVDSENNAIRLVHDDIVYTLAGGTAGFADGRRNAARFNQPSAIAIDPDGNLYIADTQNHCIRKVQPDGTVQTIAGVPQQSGYLDADAADALFYEPSGLTLDEQGVLYISDTGNHVLRKLKNGVVTTYAGVYEAPENPEEYAEGGFVDGPADSAQFRFPNGLCTAEGQLFVADTGNHAVRMIDTTDTEGTVTTLAGNGDAGDADGAPGVGMMNKPTDVLYADGFIYIADSFNHKVKQLPLSFN